MKLSDAREHYYTFSGKLSDVNRQLCFAGIAVIWIFALRDESGNYSIPIDLNVPLLFFVFGLVFDLLHYLSSSISWGIFHRIKEKSGVGEDAEFKAPRWINWAPNILFYGKVFSSVIAYYLLTFFILETV